MHDTAVAAYGRLDLSPIGAFRVAMCNDTEAILLWAIPDWSTWSRFEQAWDGGELDGWRAALDAVGGELRRTLLVDAPLCPLRIGRQPEVSDRRPLEEIA